VYEAVTAYPDGEATLSRLAETAVRHGYDGVVRRRGSAGAGPEAVAEAYDIDVVDAVEIDTDDPTVLAGTLGSERSERTLVIVRGGDERINRQAVEDPRVDVLAAPMQRGGDVNHVLAAAAARNDVHLEFDLGPVLGATGGRRVRALSGLRKLREIVADADAPFVVTANPHSHLQLRAPRELRALGSVIGFQAETIETGLEAWGHLAARNRERRSANTVEPGVEVESPDGGDGP
jgi:ribonuclease P/MRP protein subunit RPP1